MDDMQVTRNLNEDQIRAIIAEHSGCAPEDVDILIDGEEITDSTVLAADARTTIGALKTANAKHAKRVRAADAEANADAIVRALATKDTDQMFDILSSAPAAKGAK